MAEVAADMKQKQELLNHVPVTGIHEDDMKQAGTAAGTVVKGKRSETSYTMPGQTAVLRPLRSASSSSPGRGVTSMGQEVKNQALADMIASITQGKA